MPVAEIEQNYQRITAIIKLMDNALQDADIKLQTVFSSHLTTLASGHVEISVRAILGEYARTRSNEQLKKFVHKTVSWENSLNVEKIEKILDRFDSDWVKKLAAKISLEEKEAINSLKTLRDDIAHGKHNGTGYIVVQRYFSESIKFIQKLDNIVLG
jgi:RiboL-PSP-HEPN